MKLNKINCFVVGIMIVGLLFVVDSAAAMEYNESPMLTEMVEQGELPPVEERLPEEPKVVEPIGEIGEYGGTITMGFAGRHYIYNSMLAGRFTDHEPFTWDELGTELSPNWLSEAEISEDGKIYTIQIREGVKWSDGTPLTVDHLLYVYRDVGRNEELYPSTPGWLEGIEFSKVDDYTLELHLPEPSPLFKYTFQPATPPVHQHPKHYMQQFHADYADEEELNSLIKDEGFENWWELYELKAENDNPDRPTLHMWKLVEATPEHALLERNPYYWKVDPEGNQLPYVDRVRMENVGSGDVVTMRSMAGEYDFTIFHIDLADYPTLTGGEEEGGYATKLWDGIAVDAFLKFNQNYDEHDADKAEILREPQFRKALSYAIDREEINELVFLGTARPVQISPPVDCPLFEEEYPAKYAVYQPEKAETMLDELDLIDESGDGWRQYPDGEDFRIEIIASSDWADHVDVAELIKDYWESIGIRTDMEPVSFERRSTLESAAEHEVSMWKIDNIIYPAYLEADRGFPTFFDESPGSFAPLWSDWLDTDGETGVEPPQEIIESDELYAKMLATTDPDERLELTRSLWEDYYYEYLWTVGLVQQTPSPIVVVNELENVPENAATAWPLRTPVNAGVFQWYFSE